MRNFFKKEKKQTVLLLFKIVCGMQKKFLRFEVPVVPGLFGILNRGEFELLRGIVQYPTKVAELDEQAGICEVAMEEEFFEEFSDDKEQHSLRLLLPVVKRKQTVIKMKDFPHQPVGVVDEVIEQLIKT
ncbi:MAG: hypothetical protein V1707_01225 [bacterium]